MYYSRPFIPGVVVVVVVVGGGYVHRISREGDDQMGVKAKTQKIPRASNKTPKNPGPNLNPQKILCRISKP